jgi:transcriptional activator for dhaKLM operon
VFLGRAATQVDSTGTIELAHLPVMLRLTRNMLHKNQMINTIHPLSEVERDAILQTTRLYQGNVTQIAQALGISRTTLWRKLKEYETLPEDYRQ